MVVDNPITNWFVRIWHGLECLLSDLLYLLEPNKLFVYSWMKYKGGRMLHNNWGDDINKYFIESISSLKIKNLYHSYLFKLFPVKSYSCIGSIFGIFPAKRYEVWGSGIIEEDYQLISIPQKIHSVRGPLTRQVLQKRGIDCPKVYGDPSLLISRYYRKYVDKRYLCGIIPHYIDENNPALIEFCRHHPEYIIIKMQGYFNWHDIPDQIMQCRRIISSSLHGLIMADSYGVPNTWVRFSDKILGGDFKYKDYFLSVGRKVDSPFYIKSSDDLERVIIEDNMTKASHIDYRSIFDACPFKEKLIDYNTLVPQLPMYKSWQEKELNYCENFYVRTQSELDEVLLEINVKENSFYFRGVNDAKSKLFSSSQRHWMQKSDCMLQLGTTDYYQAIELLIELSKKNKKIKSYLEKRQNLDNDMEILALMQHYGVPSPIIDFSPNIRKALLLAIKGTNSWKDCSSDTINDYVSLYYFDINSDWVLSSVHKVHNKSITPEDVKIFMSTDSPALAQDDFFIQNNTIYKPIVEVINDQSNSRSFFCLNIHKSLIPYIKKQYIKTSNL